jgi:hypothetical protein
VNYTIKRQSPLYGSIAQSDLTVARGSAETTGKLKLLKLVSLQDDVNGV